MNFLKIVGIIVGFVFAAFVITPAFLENEYTTQRSVLVKAPIDSVFVQVSNVKNWIKWGPWMKDKTLKVQFGDKIEGVGASYSWTSENSGDGILTIARLEQNKSLHTNLNFDGSPANGFWAFEQESQGVKVTWGFKGIVDSYFERYLSLVIDTMAGKMFEEGLENLKKVAENAFLSSDKQEKGETGEKK